MVTNEETENLIGFAATIIRSRIYTLLKDEMEKIDRKQNYMTVPAAIRELEKIELIRGADGEYNLDYAITATQKPILRAFDMTAENVRRRAREISSDLMRIFLDKTEAEASKSKNAKGICEDGKKNNIA